MEAQLGGCFWAVAAVSPAGFVCVMSGRLLSLHRGTWAGCHLGSPEATLSTGSKHSPEEDRRGGGPQGQLTSRDPSARAVRGRGWVGDITRCSGHLQHQRAGEERATPLLWGGGDHEKATRKQGGDGGWLAESGLIAVPFPTYRWSRALGAGAACPHFTKTLRNNLGGTVKFTSKCLEGTENKW